MTLPQNPTDTRDELTSWTVDPVSWRGRLLVPCLIYVGLLVAAVSSLGAPLLSAISHTYGVSLADAQWSLTVGLLAGAVSLPLIGRLGTGCFRREVLLGCVAVMVLGCVLSGLAPNIGLFLSGRALQGVGMAMIPVAMGIARDHLPPDRRGRAIANLGITTVVGVAIGFPLSGLSTDVLGLRTTFWLAGLLGVLALLVCLFVLPSGHFLARTGIDPLTVTALTVGIAGLVLYLSEGTRWGWGSPVAWCLLTVSILALVLLVLRDSRLAKPVLDLHLMRNRVVLSANVTAFLFGLGSYILLTLYIRFVQTPADQGYGFGASTLISGLLQVPMSVLGFAGSRVVDRLARRIGPHRILPLGAVLFAASMVTFIFARGQLWLIFVEMAVVGMAVACSFPLLPRLIVRSVPSSNTSSAIALNQLLRVVGTAAGSAVSASVLAIFTLAGAVYPRNDGYTVAALISVASFLVAGLITAALVSRRTYEASSGGPAQVVDAAQAAAGPP